MRREDLELLLRRDPCPRLRLHMTGGEVFEIEEPDSIVFGRPVQESREMLGRLLAREFTAATRRVDADRER